MTVGETAAEPGAPPLAIAASDIYQWLPGRRFVMHPAYGRIGDTDVGGLEVIGHDPATGHFRTHFFDSQGNVIQQALSWREDGWRWEGSQTRCTGVFSDGRRTLTAYHERSEDGRHWTPSMTVTLRRVD